MYFILEWTHLMREIKLISYCLVIATILYKIVDTTEAEQCLCVVFGLSKFLVIRWLNQMMTKYYYALKNVSII